MIFINDIPALRTPESCEYIFDDRIEKEELINGTAYQDYGHVESGDSFSLSCVFSKTNYERFKAIWQTRPRPCVSFTDEAGTIHFNLLPVFRRIRYVPKFPRYVILTFELWRC